MQGSLEAEFDFFPKIRGWEVILKVMGKYSELEEYAKYNGF